MDPHGVKRPHVDRDHRLALFRREIKPVGKRCSVGFKAFAVRGIAIDLTDEFLNLIEAHGHPLLAATVFAVISLIADIAPSCFFSLVRTESRPELCSPL